MIKIQQVTTKKDIKEFLNFPLRLYADNPYFVPPLYYAEKKMFSDEHAYSDTCESVFFNAYRDGVMVGRIQGILQKAHNEKTGEKRIRFTRFDCLNDQEAAAALFTAVEDWGRSLGMEKICGPLGYSDLEREGLLIEGFDQMSTFEEQYNADYYQRLIEDLGYEKEVDWLEYRLYPPDKADERFEKTVAYIMRRYKLHYVDMPIKEIISRYADKFFVLLDESYDELYGTVPFTPKMKAEIIDNFKLLCDRRFVGLLVDENDDLVCMGVCFPAMGEALVGSGGHLTPAALARVLKAVKKPKYMDLGLIGVSSKHINHGLAAILCYSMINMMKKNGIEYCETNLNLEDNHEIHNLWKRFRAVQHKRRRAFVKSLI